MKTYTIILFFISGSIFSQNTEALKKSALKDAETATQAALDRNLSTILKYTHPKIHKTYGQSELMDTMNEIFKTMDAQNIKILSSKINEVSDVKQENNEFRCLVKTTTEMDFNGRAITLKGSLFGFYNDKKSQWYFVESNKLLDDPETQKIFSKFKTAIEIPQDEHITDN